MTRVRISDDVLAREVEDQTVLLDLAVGQCYVLDGVAAQVWSMLRQGDEPEEIVQQPVDDYDVEEATARRDVEDLIIALVERGLAGAAVPDTG